MDGSTLFAEVGNSSVYSRKRKKHSTKLTKVIILRVDKPCSGLIQFANLIYERWICQRREAYVELEWNLPRLHRGRVRAIPGHVEANRLRAGRGDRTARRAGLGSHHNVYRRGVRGDPG